MRAASFASRVAASCRGQDDLEGVDGKGSSAEAYDAMLSLLAQCDSIMRQRPEAHSHVNPAQAPVAEWAPRLLRRLQGKLEPPPAEGQGAVDSV